MPSLSSLFRGRSPAPTPNASYAPPPGPPPSQYAPPTSPPPSQEPAPPIYVSAGGTGFSSGTNATLDDYERGNAFCMQHPHALPAQIFQREFAPEEWGLVSDRSATQVPAASPHIAETLYATGALAMHVALGSPTELGHFAHRLEVVDFQASTRTLQLRSRKDNCFVSNLPIIAGNYGTSSRLGAYFEVTVRELLGGTTMAIGMQCLPYPPHRLPGWHRRSAALHLDDGRLYFDDSDGGRDYLHADLPEVKAGDTIGCGYLFKRPGNPGGVFYTYNGALLPIAFPGIFDFAEGREPDVFAAVGVTDGPCSFEVNFGGGEFVWKGPNPVGSEGVAWAQELWDVKRMLAQLGDGPPRYDS
ncbi:Endosome protein [Mycena kentingensis (nom. inval.)]|nr:Endosome protein [Mycena kentingensis (nom. inval.)]